MKVLRYNELNESQFKYFDEKSNEENDEILRDKLQKLQKRNVDENYTLIIVSLNKFGKLETNNHSISTKIMYNDKDWNGIKQTIKRACENKDVKYAYLMEHKTIRESLIGPNLKDTIEECKLEVDVKKYNL